MENVPNERDTEDLNAAFSFAHQRFIRDGHATLPCGATLSWPDDDDIAEGMARHDATTQRTCILELPANGNRTVALTEAHRAGLIVRGVRYRESLVPTAFRGVLGVHEALTDATSTVCLDPPNRPAPRKRPPYAKKKRQGGCA